MSTRGSHKGSSDVQPMQSARVAAGVYEVLGTSTHVMVCRSPELRLRDRPMWSLVSDGRCVGVYATKRAALQAAQLNPQI